MIEDAFVLCFQNRKELGPRVSRLDLNLKSLNSTQMIIKKWLKRGGGYWTFRQYVQRIGTEIKEQRNDLES